MERRLSEETVSATETLSQINESLSTSLGIENRNIEVPENKHQNIFSEVISELAELNSIMPNQNFSKNSYSASSMANNTLATKFGNSNDYSTHGHYKADTYPSISSFDNSHYINDNSRSYNSTLSRHTQNLSIHPSASGKLVPACAMKPLLNTGHHSRLPLDQHSQGYSPYFPYPGCKWPADNESQPHQ